MREWFRGFVVARRGAACRRDLAALAPLNRLIEREEAFAQIIAAPQKKPPLALQPLRRWRTPEALLAPIGEALARLVCTEDFTYVKACEGSTCTLLFADHTRSRQRRWCSMALCGNRAKQAAHRERVRGRRG